MVNGSVNNSAGASQIGGLTNSERVERGLGCDPGRILDELSSSIVEILHGDCDRDHHWGLISIVTDSSWTYNKFANGVDRVAIGQSPLTKPQPLINSSLIILIIDRPAPWVADGSG